MVVECILSLLAFEAISFFWKLNKKDKCCFFMYASGTKENVGVVFAGECEHIQDITMPDYQLTANLWKNLHI